MEIRNKISILIFDRNKTNIEIIAEILAQECDDVNVVGGDTQLERIEDLVIAHSPDLVFMDASMLMGADLPFLKHGFRNFEIVFIAEDSEFAIEAFKYSALYCISKPFVQSQFVNAVNRFKIKRSSYSVKQLENLFEKQNLDSTRIMLPDVFGFRLVNTNDIIRCEAHSCYTNFHMVDDERIVVSKPMSSFIHLLPKQTFCRVHNKHLVNLNYVNKYIKGRGGIIILNDGSSVDVSERKKKEFLEHLKSIAYSFSKENDSVIMK
ncbi:LytR/AlgR family response regulator transcription factor [Marinifilum sp. RC60d5]|uniref:LytR/AlgR family response regulator transcription factor n=1 Tax=Marinifilum sp. RC60d5 TaxID=3458414 RepID=UPI0040374536